MVRQEHTVAPLAPRPRRIWDPEAVGGAGESGLRERGGHGAAEERVLEGIVGLHPRLRVVVQHAENEVLELAVVCGGVAWFPLANSPRSPSLHAQNVVQGATAGSPVYILQRDRETGREGDRERGRQGERERGRQGEREAGREGDRERGKGDSRCSTCNIVCTCIKLQWLLSR